MLAPTSSPEAGGWLRAARKRLRLSTREVERLSYEIAAEKKDRQYYLSHGWLTDIENGRFKPGILKLYSLSAIYRCSYDEILTLFGIPIGAAAGQQGGLMLPHTHLVGTPAGNGRTIEAPIELRDQVRWEETNLVSRMFERWGEVPLVLLQQVDWRHSLYGYIGIEDETLYPLIRPGSLVQIDARQRKITTGNWHSDFDRPIYFVELRDRYVCTWCELNGSRLILIPTPQSGEQARHVRYPEEAEILGRVTAVTMRIAEMVRAQSRE